jgi:hypothetical protein
LGDYALDEPRSIVIMDNATIHISDKVEQLIRDSGALMINTAPYSPEINPIEYMFSVYKAGLKRRSNQFEMDWFDRHYFSLLDVTPQAALNIFRHCNMPQTPVAETTFDKNSAAVVAVLAAAASVIADYSNYNR